MGIAESPRSQFAEKLHREFEGKPHRNPASAASLPLLGFGAQVGLVSEMTEILPTRMTERLYLALKQTAETLDALREGLKAEASETLMSREQALKVGNLVTRESQLLLIASQSLQHTALASISHDGTPAAIRGLQSNVTRRRRHLIRHCVECTL